MVTSLNTFDDSLTLQTTFLLSPMKGRFQTFSKKAGFPFANLACKRMWYISQATTVGWAVIGCWHCLHIGRKTLNKSKDSLQYNFNIYTNTIFKHCFHFQCVTNYCKLLDDFEWGSQIFFEQGRRWFWEEEGDLAKTWGTRRFRQKLDGCLNYFHQGTHIWSKPGACTYESLFQSFTESYNLLLYLDPVRSSMICKMLGTTETESTFHWVQ